MEVLVIIATEALSLYSRYSRERLRGSRRNLRYPLGRDSPAMRARGRGREQRITGLPPSSVGRPAARRENDYDTDYRDEDDTGDGSGDDGQHYSSNKVWGWERCLLLALLSLFEPCLGSSFPGQQTTGSASVGPPERGRHKARGSMQPLYAIAGSTSFLGLLGLLSRVLPELKPPKPAAGS